MNNIHNTRKKTGSIGTSANYITYLLNTRVDWIIRISQITSHTPYMVSLLGLLEAGRGEGGGEGGGGLF